MPAHLWTDPGTWIAIGISVLFLVVALAMHLVIRRVLKSKPRQQESEDAHE
jgi:heme exporter protein D